MIPVIVSPKFAILGLNSQILFKTCKKWGNICRIHILRCMSIRFCTLTIHNITKVISYDAKPNVFKIFYFGVKQSNYMQKLREIGKYL